ncbi:MAG: 4Fe-4S dicluster domain-containing protein [Desulfobacteraceae bacterium]|nr:MAG: 4Fe-4S dicluster domain-containing protein [Desulfobacteraceae bacterium]
MTSWRQPLDKERIQVPRGIIHVIEERCKGCGFCVEFCPQHKLILSKTTNTKGYHHPQPIDNPHCIHCGLCTLICPDFAIYVEYDGLHTPDTVVPINRNEEVQCFIDPEKPRIEKT